MTDNVEVIYNDTCPICSREVTLYKKATDDTVIYHGLSDADLQRFGLDADSAARSFHVVQDGKLISGVAAFAILWDKIPRLRWAARLVRAPLLAPVVEWLYSRIAAPALYALHKRRQARAA